MEKYPTMHHLVTGMCTRVHFHYNIVRCVLLDRCIVWIVRLNNSSIVVLWCLTCSRHPFQIMWAQNDDRTHSLRAGNLCKTTNKILNISTISNPSYVPETLLMPQWWMQSFICTVWVFHCMGKNYAIAMSHDWHRNSPFNIFMTTCLRLCCRFNSPSDIDLMSLAV